MKFSTWAETIIGGLHCRRDGRNGALRYVVSSATLLPLTPGALFVVSLSCMIVYAVQACW